MRKARWVEVGKVEVSDDGDGPPQLTSEGDVLIRVTVAGVCATDLHLIRGRLGLVRPPAVLGHEIAGVVVRSASAACRFVPGDRVKCDSVIGCGRCCWCRRGATQFCPEGVELGISRPGGWAEYVVAPERNLYALPDGILDEVAAIMDVEVLGAMRKLAIQPGESVAIFGLGPAGLIAVQLARSWGAGRVILCGTRRDRLDLGRRLGAHFTIDITRESPLEAIRELTAGAGADAAFEAAGTPRAVLDLLASVRPQGRVVLYGLHGQPIPQFPVDQAVLKDLTIHAALPDRTGWQELMELVATGGLDLASLITYRFPLEQVGEAITLLEHRDGGAVKVVLLVSQPDAAPPRVRAGHVVS